MLHCCDVFEFIPVLKDDSVDLLITSPPYNIGKEYEARETLDSYKRWASRLIEMLKGKIKKGGAVCWQVGNYVKDGNIVPLDVIYIPLFLEHGFNLRNRIIWTYGHGLHSTNKLSGRYEVLLYFVKGKSSNTFNLDLIRVPSKEPAKRAYKGPNKGSLSGNPYGKNPGDVWKIIETEFDAGMWDFPNVKSNHIEKSSHPCQFPIELAERCVLAFSGDDDLIVDPFCGMGTTGIAAVIHQRRFIGCDYTREYIENARQRIHISGTDPAFTFRYIGTPISEASTTTKTRQYPAEWKDELGKLTAHSRLVETDNQRLYKKK